MDNTYLATDFNEIQSKQRFTAHGSTENLENFCHYFTSSDESFNSNSSSSSGQSFEKKNDLLKTCDLLLNADDSRSNCVNYNDVQINQKATKKEQNQSSIMSIIKYVKKLSLKSEKTNESSQQNRSILRRPTEYTFVKGMSGLPIRVAKSSPSSSNRQRYVSKD